MGERKQKLIRLVEIKRMSISNLILIKFQNELQSFTHAFNPYLYFINPHIYKFLAEEFLEGLLEPWDMGFASMVIRFWRLLLDIFWGQVSGRISRVNWLQFILMLETVGCCILLTSWMSGCFLGKPGLHQRFI